MQLVYTTTNIKKLIYNEDFVGVRVIQTLESDSNKRIYDIEINRLLDNCESSIIEYLSIYCKEIPVLYIDGKLKSKEEISKKVEVEEIHDHLLLLDIIDSIRGYIATKTYSLIAYYTELISSFKENTSPFIRSERDDALAILRSQQKLQVEEVIKGVPYLLTEGWGSIYKGNNSLGYFIGGFTTLIVKSFNGREVVAKIRGNTFKVVQDASFGNRSSIARTYEAKSLFEEGYIPIDKFPKVITYNKAIGLLEAFRCNK